MTGNARMRVVLYNSLMANLRLSSDWPGGRSIIMRCLLGSIVGSSSVFGAGNGD